MPARSGAARRGLVTGTAPLLLCLATLAALFAMHGPSSDHTLDMPGSGAAMAAMISTDPNGPATAAPRTATGSGETHPARPAANSVAPGITVAAAPSSHMSHPQCLATLRPTQHLPTVLAGEAPRASVVLLSGAALERGASQRGPPRPSLDRLCISRT